MTAPHSISVVMPVYNEALTLPAAVAAIDRFLAAHFRDHEILLIESGSTDGSGPECDRLAAALPAVRVIHEGARNGYGSALQLGFQAATGDLVWMITADMPFPLEAVLQALPLLNRYDVVLSYRSRDPRSLPRRVQSVVYNVLVKRLLRLPVRHVNSAFKLYKREALRSLPLGSRTWFIDAEIVHGVVHGGIPFVEIPVELIDRADRASSITPGTPRRLLAELWAFARHSAARRARSGRSP
jgi:glycosyltransferase involved in cell wall biosynthesis